MYLHNFSALIIVFSSWVISSSISAQSGSTNPDSFEFKVMFNNALFASNDRDTGIDKVIEFINDQPEIVVHEDRKEKSRIVSYFDTKKCDLYGNNYILRKRFTLKNDIPDRLKITMKYRGSKADEVGSISFETKPTSSLTESKYEVDIVRGSSSQTQHKFSYSGSIELGKIKKVSDLLSLYPELIELNIDNDKKIKTVNDFTAFETVLEIGTISIAAQKCKASFSFWYENKEKTHPIVSEFSYVCSKFTDEGQDLFQTILRKNNWVNADSPTKTAIAYGNYCNN